MMGGWWWPAWLKQDLLWWCQNFMGARQTECPLFCQHLRSCMGQNELLCGDCLLFLWTLITTWYLGSLSTLRSAYCRWLSSLQLDLKAQIWLPHYVWHVNTTWYSIWWHIICWGEKIGEFWWQNPYILAIFTTFLFVSLPLEGVRTPNFFTAHVLSMLMRYK